MRSFLTLLGITIGIFCIIAVKSSVNSLEENIRSSLEKIGDDVVYVSKMPWDEDPGMNFWKYMRRPNPSHDDYQALFNKSKLSELVAYSIFLGSKTIKYGSSSIQGVFLIGATDEYDDLFKVELDKGRFYTPTESRNGTYQVVLGYEVAKTLFGQLDPVGKKVKILGHTVEVIGVIKKSGKDLINPVNFDECVLMSFNLAKRIGNVRPTFSFGGGQLMAKARKGVNIEDLKGEITNILRAERRLKPRETTNFSTNTLSILSGFLDGIFSVINIAGFIIGIFALVVGMFSVANIMFVSVKERTNIIGIKKALGAKRGFILLEFLIESIILCVLGGILGLIVVFVAVKIITYVYEFEIFLSMKNIMIGLITSIIVGIISGIIPAWQAAKMDPVEAIRR